MSDLLVGIGLVLVIEGMLWALFPGLARKALEAAAGAPPDALRIGGVVAAVAGFVIVWWVRGSGPPV